jgi:putative transcriptional regulator
MDSHAGKLLVASPLLVDGNFHQTVVLIIEHDRDNGAIGLVLNRPSPVPIGEILEAWHAPASDPKVVFVGGPVQRDVAIGLGRTARSDAKAVVGLMGMVDLGESPETEEVLGDVRVFSGYSGWEAGQLEAEIDEGAWFVLPALAADTTTAVPEDLWRTVLGRQKARTALYATYPRDPRDN